MKSLALVLVIFLTLTGATVMADTAAPRVLIETNLGNITLELDSAKAPDTVANFLAYVDEGFFDGLIFHRVIPGFMIQGGGFDTEFVQKQTRGPVQNEAGNGLMNTAGTIAMARTSSPHSATAQFFINVADNGFLNHTAPTSQGWGYAVFGKVVEGMDTVNAIAAISTGRHGMHDDVPREPVVMSSVRRVAE